MSEAQTPAAPAVSDEAIKALEDLYPVKRYRGDSPANVAAERLAKVQKLLQITQSQIEGLRTPVKPTASASVTQSKQRARERNLAFFIKQEAQVKKDLVVAQAALDRLTGDFDFSAELPDLTGWQSVETGVGGTVG
jgi:tRNA A37 threonylcarbamoyladenosine synthetase subunit TsaC/SUA5/YrdC